MSFKRIKCNASSSFTPTLRQFSYSSTPGSGWTAYHTVNVLLNKPLGISIEGFDAHWTMYRHTDMHSSSCRACMYWGKEEGNNTRTWRCIHNSKWHHLETWWAQNEKCHTACEGKTEVLGIRRERALCRCESMQHGYHAHGTRVSYSLAEQILIDNGV